MIHRLGPSSLYSLDLYLQTQQLIQQSIQWLIHQLIQQLIQQLMSNCDKPQNSGHLQTELSAIDEQL